MDALILFSHGSLLCGAGEALEAHAARLRERGGFPLVAIGYLNYSEPTFAETAESVIAAGATRIVVAPYFLVPGYFVNKSLPEAVAPVQLAHPDVEFVVADALGYAPSLAEALLESALSARTDEHWREPLQRAARSCQANPGCPLFGTSTCPASPGHSVHHKEMAAA
jgi:sirohydrochlorin cobaltochelatase